MGKSANTMTSVEKRTAMGLAGVYGFRMLGLFLILPVFALYAESLESVTPFLVGLAVGIYGLTQAALQIPFGMLSDRIGRKPVIFAGLLLFALGSVIAATADDIWMIIIGRAVQGSGAVAAAVMALAADLTREENRTKAMAMIGMTIGFSFMLAMILGPLLNSWIGVSGIFWLTALLALVGIAIIGLVVPTPESRTLRRDATPVPALFAKVLANRDLLRLNVGIFILHLLLTALFLVVPLALRDVGLAPESHAWLYLPVMLLSIAAMVPFIILAEKKGKLKGVFLFAIAVLCLGQMLLWFGVGDFWFLAVALWVFFSAFNLLEATLPSLVSKTAPADAKGTAMGVYSTSQFLGAFVGGIAGGWIHQVDGISGVFIAGALLTIVWLLVAKGMSKPGRYSSKLLALGCISQELAQQLVSELRSVRGVIEAVVVADEGVAYLKVENSELDNEGLALIVAKVA